MKFIVGVTLLVIQLSSTRGLDLDHASEHSENKEILITSNISPVANTNHPANVVQKESITPIRDVRELNLQSDRDDREKADEIMFNIKARRFNRALEHAQTLKDTDIQGVMNYVIHEIYNNAAGNVNLILQFVDSIEDITINLAILEALNNEMNENNHNDLLLRLRVIKSFNSKTRESWYAEKLKRELHNFVSNAIVEALKNAVKTKDSTTIFTISENIYNNYPELFNEVIKQVLKETFYEIDSHYLVKYFMSHKYASQRIWVYSAMLEELKKGGGYNQSLVVTLASGLKEALALKNSLDKKSYDEGFRLKSLLPLSVKNLAFAKVVCIVNKNKEYLYGASDYFNTDEGGRSIFTWMPKNKVYQGYWLIERHGDVYRIKNHRNESQNEYMYARTVGTSIEFPARQVLTWIAGGTRNDSDEFNWSFEPSVPFVYIRNEGLKEYLFSGHQNKDNRRYVYTDGNNLKGGFGVRESLWMIENCPFDDLLE